jgi:hypothetical protein
MRNGNQRKPNQAIGTRRAAAKTSAPPRSKAETGEEKEAKKKEEKEARKNAEEEAREKEVDAKAAAGETLEEPGAGLLEDAADTVVASRCTELANALMDAAVKGNASCAKVLVTLTERVRIQKKAGKGTKGPSAAQLAASEPDWLEAPEAGSEAGGGGREAKAQ